MSYLLALDQGTTSSRAVIFDARGNLVGMAQQEFPQLYPQPGWVEHDPETLWNSQLETARLALSKTGLKAREMVSIGITNQRETTLVWERSSGRPIHNAIVWQDRRTADVCARLKAEGHEALVRKRTGLLLDPYFSGTKLAWILDHVPGARKRAERGELAFGTVDSWLVWRLTHGRVHATDPSNAARTLLFDIYRNTWDDELLDLLRVPRAVLPQVQPSASDFGQTDTEWLGASIRIGGVAGDQQAALFGQACHKPGMVKNTYGTGCFMLMHTGSTLKTSSHGLLGTAAAQTSGTPAFALEGSVFIAGALVQWLRDGLGMIRSAAEIEPLARSVPNSDGVVIVPAFVGLGSPHWDPQARGALFGLTRGSTRAHVARAALDAIAFQSAELIEAMQADAGQSVEALRVDGGAISNDLLLQIQADLLGVPVIRPRVAETTALGAAYLAGITSGIWASESEVAGQWQAERVFGPAISRDEAASRIQLWHKAVTRSRGWAES
ncbi:glycerol kinase GlpK [Uliginosibacterium sp. 31-16]|uniref:glycerol kinase GlpK n=1 Tax=Uliginosibacterium sp. 31-16 TaxID=3068315 RepID=UPI00273E3C7D|nr:glycerol kinase GlpK [Uliginosibacterium sp. 31-16]MDP5240304.1 glycerol kinase GlpK [Uliginosibacterium sp. 31-16]